MSKEADIDELQTVALGMECHGLAKSCRVVFDGDVLESDVLPFHFDRIGAEGSHGLGGSSLVANFRDADVGMVVVGDDGLLGILATDLNVGEP